jgi:hypothetical protein
MGEAPWVNVSYGVSLSQPGMELLSWNCRQVAQSQELVLPEMDARQDLKHPVRWFYWGVNDC